MALKLGYKLPDTYRLGTPGMGCYLCPPGHPRYFAQPVWTQHGNSPRNGSAQFFLPGVGYFTDWDTSVIDKYYGRKAYPKVEMDSERFRAWERELYRHMRNCYRADGDKETFTYPVPSYKLKHFHDDPRFSDEWRAKEKAAIEQANAEILAAAEWKATPDNHNAVRAIRKYFPDYQPNLELIANPPTEIADWYTTMDHKPTPEECPGERGLGPHPVNKTWCQFCGWKGEEAPE